MHRLGWGLGDAVSVSTICILPSLTRQAVAVSVTFEHSQEKTFLADA